MQKTNVLIYNGASDKGRKFIKILLDEGKTVICLDEPSKIYEMQDFLAYENFTYYSIVPNSPLSLGINVDEVIFFEE